MKPALEALPHFPGRSHPTRPTAALNRDTTPNSGTDPSAATTCPLPNSRCSAVTVGSIAHSAYTRT